MGVLIPLKVYHAIGVNEETYHFFAIVGGSFTGLMVVIGIIVILIRKFNFPRVRVHTSGGGYFSIMWMLLVAGLGTYMTLIYNTTIGAYEYRLSIGPWFI